jgi:membrane associated rhomboid family serine protease
MIPIADNTPNRDRPLVTYWLIGINLALFLWELRLELTGELYAVVNSWGVIPAQITTVARDTLAGGNPAAVIALILIATSLLKGIFLHGSFSQILGNLLFLWVFGSKVEGILGWWRYLGFYLISGILMGIIQILADSSLNVPLIGANGAIASILGAYLIAFPQAKIDSILPLLIIYIPVELPALFYLFWWFVQQAFYGIGSLNITPGVNPLGWGYLSANLGLLWGAIVVFWWKRDRQTV